MKPLHHKAECGPSVDLPILQHEVLEISYPKITMGWTVTEKQLSVSAIVYFVHLFNFFSGELSRHRGV